MCLREHIRQRVSIEDRGHSTACWIWQMALNEKGYARTSLPGFGPRPVRIHRAAYEEYVAPIPDGLQIDHLCSQVSCVNPAHLEPVTAEENRLRQTIRNGHVVGSDPRSGRYRGITLKRPNSCRHGHEYTPETTVIMRNGSRYCAICSGEKARVMRRADEFCPNGHAYSETEMVAHRGKSRCRTCYLMRKARWHQRRREQKMTVRAKIAGGSEPKARTAEQIMSLTHDGGGTSA